jgi:hypothetical protein
MSGAPVFCNDDDLEYARSATRFLPGEPLRFDGPYRLAHLPLVNPSHPLGISRRDGTHYIDGRHPEVFSLVAPIPEDALEASSAFQDLQADMRAASFAPKIAWDIVRRRSGKLHATVCGGLGPDAATASFDLSGIAPFELELRGLFSGNINLGRLYLKAYPQRVDDRNALATVQTALGRKTSDLYPVGIYNLSEELSGTETGELAGIIRRWWDRPLLRLRIDQLWLLASRDDLVLDSRILRPIYPGQQNLP